MATEHANLFGERAGTLRARMEVDAKAIYPRSRVERLYRWTGAAFGVCHAFLRRSGVRAGDDPIAVRPYAVPQGRGATLQRFE